MERKRALLPLSTALVLLAACSAAAPDASPAGAAAGAGTGDEAAHAQPGVTTPASANDPRVEAYLSSLYDRSAVRHSFTTTRGSTVDCVDFASEPGVRSLTEKGVALSTILAGVRGTVPAHSAEEALQANPYLDGLPDEAGQTRACPEMTVPHVRLTAERIAAAGGLDAYRARLGAAAQRSPRQPTAAITPIVRPDANSVGTGGQYSGDPGDFGHVLSFQNGSVMGGTATMAIGNVGNSAMFDSTINHSLGQIWIEGSGSALQTLEAGWIIDGEIGGPYLFVSSTQDDYRDYCFNNRLGVGDGTTCVTWIGNPGTPLYPGADLPMSITGGAQHELTIQVIQHWYYTLIPTFTTVAEWTVNASVDGGAVYTLGAYLDTGYGTGALSTGVGSQFNVGGEVRDESWAFNEVSMGEGDLFLGTAFYGSNAYMRNYGYYSNECFASDLCSRPLNQTGSTVYTTQSEFAYNVTAPAGSSSWSNWFYYGNFFYVKFQPILTR